MLAGLVGGRPESPGPAGPCVESGAEEVWRWHVSFDPWPLRTLVDVTQ